MQIGRQAENSALHPIQREPTGLRTFALNGYLEGWAEHAAGLCAEIGLYTDPADAYGRLCMERFQAALGQYAQQHQSLTATSPTREND
jgi:uncharacterized protein (DUF885 family)